MTRAPVSSELEVLAAGLLSSVRRAEGDHSALALLARMEVSAAAPVMAAGQKEPLLGRLDAAARGGQDPWPLADAAVATPEPTLPLSAGPARVLAGACIALCDVAMSSPAGRAAMVPLLLRERDHCPRDDRSYGELSLRLAELARDSGDRDAAGRYLDEASAVTDDRIRARAARLRAALR
jgi:hypothetical protein